MAAQWKQSESERAQEMGGWETFCLRAISRINELRANWSRRRVYFVLSILFHLFITVH